MACPFVHAKFQVAPPIHPTQETEISQRPRLLEDERGLGHLSRFAWSLDPKIANM